MLASLEGRINPFVHMQKGPPWKVGRETCLKEYVA